VTSPWDRQRAGEKYQPGTPGWMVGHTAPVGPAKRESTAWWYGPAHGWGKTYGGLGYPGPRVWRTKANAEAALRHVYGSLAYAERTGHRVMRVADAESIDRLQREGVR
jgi:hypothetical protein